MNQVNVVSHMIQNEDFNTISQIAVVNNADVDETETDVDDLLEEDDIEDETLENNIQVPSTYTNLEELNVSAADNWMVAGSQNKTDLTRESGKDSFNDKEKLIRAIKLYCIKAHKHFMVVESCPGYTPSYKKVWVGKQKVIEEVFGNWEESYNLLPKFLYALQRFNPGTMVEWCISSISRQTDVHQVEFRRVFWAFAPSIQGFKHDLSIVDLLLALMAHICMNWFLAHVKKHVVKDREGICLISDRHPGILMAVNEQGSPWLEPRGFHKYCLRHFINNFNDKFHNSQLKPLAYRAGSQNQIRKFNPIMEEIGKKNRQARQWLDSHALDKWTLAHDGGKRYGLLTTLSHDGARFLPIIACVQLTFYRLVNYFDVRRPMGSGAQANGDVLLLMLLQKQEALMSKASAHSLRLFNRQKGIFEVITQKGKNVQIVNLEQKTCTCGKWEIFKYLRSHVLSAYANLSLNTWEYIHKCYSIVDYCATWSYEFLPLPHEAYWSQPSSIKELLPNSDLKQDKRGHLRSTRLQNGMGIKEKKRTGLCGICRRPGHNRARCPSKPRRMNNDH